MAKENELDINMVNESEEAGEANYQILTRGRLGRLNSVD